MRIMIILTYYSWGLLFMTKTISNMYKGNLGYLLLFLGLFSIMAICDFSYSSETVEEARIKNFLLKRKVGA